MVMSQNFVIFYSSIFIQRKIIEDTVEKLQ